MFPESAARVMVPPAGYTRVAAVSCLAAVLLVGAMGCSRSTLEFEDHSEFSHIRVRRDGEVRNLIFVQDNGREVVESRMNLARPHQLLSRYTPFMFSSYLIRPRQDRVLLIGLGGGAMIQFLRYHDPELRVDVVEIDPVVVQIADEYFDVRTGGNIRIMTADAMEYLTASDQIYDVIYMDAFLPASAGTDSSGVPLRLKTEQFYREARDRLAPGGMMVFNVIAGDSFAEDVLAIRNAFPDAFVFDIPRSANHVLIGCTLGPPTAERLRENAVEMDERFDAEFSFATLLDGLA